MHCDSKESHDDYARSLSADALTAAARDLSKRKPTRETAEGRWTAARLDALRRRIKELSKTPTPA